MNRSTSNDSLSVTMSCTGKTTVSALNQRNTKPWWACIIVSVSLQHHHSLIQVSRGTTSRVSPEAHSPRTQLHPSMVGESRHNH